MTACPPDPPPVGLRPETRKVVVIAPLDLEYDAVAKLLRERVDRELGGRPMAAGEVAGLGVVVVRSGWGKAHAAGAAGAAVEAFHPSALIVAGIAGSLDGAKLDSGDVMVASRSWQHDLGSRDAGRFQVFDPEGPREESLGRFYAADPALVRLAAAAALGAVAGDAPWQVSDCECTGRHDNLRPPCPGAPLKPRGRLHPRVCAGTIATGDQFLSGGAEASLRASGSVAVEMETAAAAQEALDAKVPFLGVRVIDDLVGAADSESIYYCLKPYAAERLSRVMEAVLRALAEPGDAPEPDSC